jgi:hypothetical protein
MQHSKIVGGSTAKRVINCPGSVPLVQQMPPQIGSKYAEEGTKLHGLMERFIEADTVSAIEMMKDLSPEQREKIEFCLGALDEIDPQNQMTYVQETTVGFEGVPALEGVFGNADLVGRIGDTAIVLDWKFGDGVMVEAEENDQGLFYAAAAMRTPSLAWAFDGATEIEIVIVQPPYVRRWVTSFSRVKRFEDDLINAVQLSRKPDAPLAIGDWCRWCTAKPICPQMTGQIDRVTHTALKDIDPDALGRALALADKLEDFIADARALAQARLEKGMAVPGWKLVPKRAVRQWADEKAMHVLWLNAGVDPTVYQEIKLRSPSQMEKVCKEQGVPFPADKVVSVSSGNTIAPESDKRPAVLVIGEQLRAALNRVQ